MPRPAGVPNRLNGEIKESFVKAFHMLQKNDNDPAALVPWAKANPDKFYPLISKLFPTEIDASIKGTMTIKWDE